MKESLPVLHDRLKDGVAGWRLASGPLVPFPKRIRGEFFWVHPRLMAVDTHDYEPHIWEWIRDHLHKGGVFFDVGAHYGWLSLKAAGYVGVNGRVVAFEASPLLVSILEYHRRRNRMRQMTVISGAVADTDGQEALFYLLNNGLSSRNSLTIGHPGLPFLADADKTAVSVSTMMLDRFCERENLRPDVIKIDVEGAEGMVLRGASEVLTRFHPVLVLSIHPHWLPDSESAAHLIDYLRSYGYRVIDANTVRVEGFDIGDYVLSSGG